MAMGFPCREYWIPTFASLLFLIVISLPDNASAQEFSSGEIIYGPCDPCGVESILLADVDQDGDNDILVGSTFSYIGWFENTGAGFSDFNLINRQPGAKPINPSRGGVRFADISGDGIPDILRGFQWYKNLGNGSFSDNKGTPIFDPHVGGYNGQSKAADVTGDGKNEVINVSSVGIGMYKNGDFSFIEHIFQADDTQLFPTLTIQDIDGDGDKDILHSAGNLPNGFTLRWIENLNDGGFGSEQIISSGDAMFYTETPMADFDGDGDKDILAPRGSQSGGSAKLSWYEHTDGEGTFGDEQILAEGLPSTIDAQPIDIDNDGDQDIITDYNYWYENDGNGNFTEHKITDKNLQLDGVELGDVNEDGLKDILYPGRSGIHWHENLNDGLWGAQQQVGKELPDRNIGAMRKADLLGNGVNELIIRGVTSFDWYKKSSVDLNYEGSFLDDKSITYPVFEDVDGDNDDDIIYENTYEEYDPDSDRNIEYGIIKWGENNGTGAFTHKTIDDALSEVNFVKSADVDNDGDRDLLGYIPVSDEIAVYPDNGDDFGSESIRIQVESNLKDIVPADIDGDGDQDLILHYWGSRGDGPPAIVWYENDSNGWDFNSGTHGLSDPNVFYEATDIPSDRSLDYFVHAGDVDSDGDLDIVNYTKWFENTDGEGTFSGPVEIDVFAIPLRVRRYNHRITDMDADGDPDVVVFDGVYSNATYRENAWRGTDYGDRNIWWHENQGGTFADRKVLVEDVGRPREIQTYDLNGDGAKDLIYRSDSYSKIEWFKNTGIKVVTNTMAAGDSAAFGATSAHIALSDNSTNSGNVIVSKANRRPVGSQGINAAYTAGIRMVLRTKGDLKIGEGSKIYFDLNELPNVNDPNSVSIFKRDTVDRGSFSELQTTYNETNNELRAAIDTTGELVFANKFPPVAVEDTFSVREDHALTQPAPGVFANDKNPQNEDLDISLVSDVTNGELTFNSDGSFEYVPETEFDSTDSFTYQITDGFSTSQTTVIINVKTQDINVAVGGSTDWQLVAFPFVSSTKTQLFTQNNDNWVLYKFSGQYFDAHEIVAGKGYWLKSKDGSQTEVHEDPKDDLSIELNSGWNLIGGVNDTLAITDVIDENDIIMESTLYGFDRIYQAADSIRAGKGYWLRAKESGGTIKLIKGLSKDKTSARVAKANSKKTLEESVAGRFNKIFISVSESKEQKFYVGGELPKGVHRKAFSLPPKPPSSMFDVRFKGGYRLTEDSHPRFQIQHAESPLTIRLETATQVEQKRYAVEAIRDDNVLTSRTLYENNPVRIFDNNIDYLRLSKASSSADSEIPREFHLEQNYPNPFNPSTTIKFGLPKATNVKITVYDILGRRVLTLTNGQKKAGWHTVKFNGNRMASGVYFYRLKTSAWTKTRRFLLVK